MVEMQLVSPYRMSPPGCTHVSTPVQGGMPQAIQASASREETLTARPCQIARPRPCPPLPLERELYIEARLCQLACPRPCPPPPLVRLAILF
ncbi:hypothetical protein JCGZ_24235 [Jatropha curcas]|uniref:Uncharacterized protein n=1 Tax=Jatropha curcas TaxID=180498 RepID=A0A067LGM4_JATCU|nr:hypothetical protein JCGZ_24235 [Jatropha curcas]